MDNSIFSYFSLNNLNLYLMSLVSGVLLFIPKIILCILIYFFGRVIAQKVEQSIVKIFDYLNLNRIITSFDLGIEIKPSTSKGIGNVLGLVGKFAVLYLTFIIIVQSLNITPVANLLLGIVHILPKLISAFVVFIVGLILSGIVESFVKKAAVSFGSATSRLISRIASYMTICFFILLSISELGFATLFINTLFIGLVASIALSLGLAVGLGSKDMVKSILESWYSRHTKKK